MVFKSKQDSLLTCRDQKCEKKPFLPLKIAFVINRNWSWPDNYKYDGKATI